MSEVARYLITNADEGTWKFDRPVIFLGEWCRIYERRQVWQKMDAIVAKPYGLGKSKIDSDIAEANLIEKELFPILCRILNDYHDTEHSERFWKIIIGHWFHEYVATILNRVNTLQKCLDDYNISGVTGYTPESQGLTVERFDPCWYDALEDAQWNSTLYLRILELTSNQKPDIDWLSFNSKVHSRSELAVESASKKRAQKSYPLSILKKLTPLLSRRKDAFIVSSYLPPEEEIKLQFRLRQFPSFWEAPQVNLKAKPDLVLRQELTNRLQNVSDEGLLKTTKALLLEILPIAYLEGFSEIQDIAKNQKWPEKPKFIFTSNAFHSSDVYKYWFASKVELGTKYIVGQHGNAYFTDRRQRNTIEEVTADKFLTWGWMDASEHYIPTFIFQNNPRKPLKANFSGGLLLINSGPALSRTTYDVSFLAHQDFEMNQTFIKNLIGEPRKTTTLRLYAGTSQHTFSVKKRWVNFDPQVQIDEGFVPIHQLISENRLIVHAYDSTGILITLSQNIPTMAFWLNGFEHLSDEVIDDYEILLKAGIIHLTPESAAKKVNEVWDKIDEWWSSDRVQEARREFCKKYAKISKGPAKELKPILLEATEIHKMVNKP
jgi:putative transferase (TIGR04331 family)